MTNSEYHLRNFDGEIGIDLKLQNPSRDEPKPYAKVQFVPRNKHIEPWLEKPVSCGVGGGGWGTLFVLRSIQNHINTMCG